MEDEKEEAENIKQDGFSQKEINSDLEPTRADNDDCNEEREVSFDPNERTINNASSPDEMTDEIPEIMVTEDSYPGSSKTLYDDEISLAGSDIGDVKSIADEELLNRTRDRLIDEMTKSDRLSEQLEKAKKVTEALEVKLHTLEEEHQELLQRQKKLDNDADKNDLVERRDEEITTLRSEIREKELTKQEEIDELINKMNILKNEKDQEIETLKNDLARVMLELHMKQEDIFKPQMSPENAEENNEAKEKEETTQYIRDLELQTASLERKLVCQEELQCKLQKYQQENILLNSTIRDQQKKYEEALRTLRMVQDNYNSRSRIMKQYSVGDQGSPVPNKSRQNPEGQSSDIKTGFQDAPSSPKKANDSNKENEKRTSKELDLELKLDLLMKSLKKSQEEAENLQTEKENIQKEKENIQTDKDNLETEKDGLEAKLEASRVSITERGKKVSELQKEVLDLKDSNENLKWKLGKNEEALAVAANREVCLLQEMTEIKNELKKQESIALQKSEFELKLIKTKGKLKLYQERLGAAKGQLTKAEEENMNQNNLVVSIPSLHKKLDDNEQKIKELKQLLKEKEDAEKANKRNTEKQKRELEKVKLAWKRKFEARLTTGLDLSSLDDGGEANRKESSGTSSSEKLDIPSLQPRRKSADSVQATNPYQTENQHKSSTGYHRKESGQRIVGYTRPLSSPSFKSRRTRSLGKYKGEGMSRPSEAVEYHQPRVLLWGADKEAPAKKLIALDDRVLIQASDSRGGNAEVTIPGVVQFIGPIKGSTDEISIGLALEKPVGHHDGKVDGIRYFRCQPMHGVFVKLEEIVRVLNPKFPQLSTLSREMVS